MNTLNQKWSVSGLWTTLKRCGGLTSLLISLAVPLSAANITIEWDANTEADLAGYSLYSSTKSLLTTSTKSATTDPFVTKLRMGTSSQVNLSTSVAVSLQLGTTMFYRLTAHDTWYNESGFNVDYSSNPAQLVVFLKNGDLNGDGLINAVDIGMVINMILGQFPVDLAADFNNDGVVNVVDISILINIALSGG